MDDTPRVQVGQGVGHLACRPREQGLASRFIENRGNRGDGIAHDQLRHQEETTLMSADVERPHHARMIDPDQTLKFVLHTEPGIVAPAKKNLQRTGPPGGLIDRPKRLALASPSKLGLDAIATTDDRSAGDRSTGVMHNRLRRAAIQHAN